VIIYWINKCTTDKLFFPLFSSLLEKRDGEKKNELAKPMFKQVFNDPFDNQPINSLLTFRSKIYNYSKIGILL